MEARSTAIVWELNFYKARPRIKKQDLARSDVAKLQRAEKT